MAALVASPTLSIEHSRPSGLLLGPLAVRVGQLAARSRCLQLQYLHSLRQSFHHASQLLHWAYRGDGSRLALRLQCRNNSSAVWGEHIGLHLQRGCHRIVECIGALLLHAEGYLRLSQLLQVSVDRQSFSCLVLQAGVSFVNEGLEVISQVSPALTHHLPASLKLGLVASLLTRQLESPCQCCLRCVECRLHRLRQALERLLCAPRQSYFQPLELLFGVPFIHSCDVLEVNAPLVPRRLAVERFGEDNWFLSHHNTVCRFESCRLRQCNNGWNTSGLGNLVVSALHNLD